MFKKLLLLSLLIIAPLSSAWSLALDGSFYLGGGLNYENLRSGNIRFQGIRPMIIGGYGDWIREGFYLAGEIYAAGPKAININNEPKNGFGLKTKYSYGGSLIPGIYLDQEVMGFARIGLVSTKFEDSINTRKSGMVLGLGLEAKIIDCWYARVEYNYISYSNLSREGTLRSDEFNLSVIYRFT